MYATEFYRFLWRQTSWLLSSVDKGLNYGEEIQVAIAFEFGITWMQAQRPTI